MTLAEKILQLRTAQNLSQGDLADRLDVSRQSVSKWETGQSVPDLEKIIRLADLFGVSVDELVRDGNCTETSKNEPQIIYIEKHAPGGLRPSQILGVLFAALGFMLVVLAFVAEAAFLWIAFGLILLSLPLLLDSRHPWLSFSWVFLMLFLLLTNPAWIGSSRWMWPWECLHAIWLVLTGRGGSFSLLLACLRTVTSTVLLPLLAFFTWKVCHSPKQNN